MIQIIKTRHRQSYDLSQPVRPAVTPFCSENHQIVRRRRLDLGPVVQTGTEHKCAVPHDLPLFEIRIGYVRQACAE